MMRISKLRMAAGVVSCTIVLTMVGCGTQRKRSAEDAAAANAARAADEARGIAEASLGKQAQILAQGDLALNGREQMLVANRFSTPAQGDKTVTNASPIFVTRAAVLEKNDGNWSQILLCDEHLKNANGYLGGAPKARITGWQLEYRQDARDGLQMSFSPADNFNGDAVNAGQISEQMHSVFHVRWNKSVKRYQGFDPSQERYLSEVPTLETPESLLK
jgi:hypothetical protein